jgi:hypothetical protein
MPGSPAKRRAKPERRGAEHRDRDARLEDRVALDDPAEARVEARPIEGMRHDADELAGRRLARELGVRVEADHVLDGA